MKKSLLIVALVVSVLYCGFAPVVGNAGKDAPSAIIRPSTAPEKINPLTGLPVEKAENLALPPALVSITNWPLSARPQAGLSYSPFVFELSIGEGSSRFLAMFYGDFPKNEIPLSSDISNTPVVAISPNPDAISPANAVNAAIGPIRSGRLPYEHLRALNNGFLIMASAYKEVADHLEQTANIFGSDGDDINSAMIGVDKLEAIASAHETRLGEDALSGLVFDPVPPPGGVAGQTFWFIYNAIDMVKWQYNEEVSAYNRYQDRGDGATFDLATDRINNEVLTYENIILLFANHRSCTETAFDIDFMYIDKLPALLFRDGQMYKIFWTTKNGEYEKTTGKLRPIRYLSENGEPFPLKPGQTWVHLTPLYTAYWESAESNSLLSLMNNTQATGSGVWVSHFYSSQMVFDQSVCDMLR